MFRVRSLVPLVAALAMYVVFATAAQAVTWFTVNGQTTGTLTLPGQLVFRADTANVGGMIQIALGVDADQDGALEAGETLLDPFCIRDGVYNDESADARVVQFTRTMSTYHMWGHFGVMVVDEDGSTVQHVYQMAGPSTGQTISGTVRHIGGTPEAGALVVAVPITFQGAELGGYQAVTAPDGGFSMQLPIGHYEVAAGWIEGTGYEAPVLYRIALGSGQSRTDLRFTSLRRLGGPNTISGRLTGPAGEPVVGHIVIATSSGWAPQWTRTDVEGAYHLWVAPGTWSVAPHSAVFGGYYFGGPPSEVSVPPDNADANFSMSVAPNVCSGTVRSEIGSPIAGATVVGVSSSSYYVVATETNALGKYALHLPGAAYVIDPQADGFALSPLGGGACVVPPDTTVNLTLQTKNVSVSGRVTRADTGAGVPYVHIWANSLMPEWEGSFESRTDANGNYIIHLAPGTWTMHLESALLGYWLFQEIDATANRTGVNFSMNAFNHPPALSNGCVTPQSGPAGTTFTFQVTYTDADNSPPIQVYAFVDGWPKNMPPVDPLDTEYTNGAVFQCTAQLGAGAHSFSFGAIEAISDEPGNIVSLPASGSYSGPTVTAAGDPQVSITSPANGATVKGTVAVAATASDSDGIQRVEFYDGATLESTDISAPYQWSWDTEPLSVADGWHNISAKAYDNTGHASQVIIAVNVDNATFDDVPKTSSQWSYIEALVGAGITSGCSTTPPLYCPTSGITRAQMAVFIIRAMGETPYANPTPTFQDVPSGHWAYGYIERLNQLHITTGCSTNPPLYCPNSAVTRAQMAVFLCRAASQSWLENSTPTFGDVPASHWAYGYVERLADPDSWGGSPVTSGCAATPQRLYCPNPANTRGQMAVFLVRAFEIPY